ncbi:MAG: hypothetical protein Q6L68_04940 [Thermostichus sp. DG02_5_bins_236]
MWHRLCQGSLLLATTLVMVGGNAHRLGAQMLDEVVLDTAEEQQEELQSCHKSR